MGQRVSSPSLAERHLFQERPSKVVPLDDEEPNHIFFHFRQDFGGNLRYGNMADGWAKISKFNVDASGVSSEF